MARPKTLYQRAVTGDIEIGDVVSNIDKCKDIAKEIKIIDIINPTSRQIGMLAELLYRVKNMPDLEKLDNTSAFMDSSTAYWG